MTPENGPPQPIDPTPAAETEPAPQQVKLADYLDAIDHIAQTSITDSDQVGSMAVGDIYKITEQYPPVQQTALRVFGLTHLMDAYGDNIHSQTRLDFLGEIEKLINNSAT